MNTEFTKGVPVSIYKAAFVRKQTLIVNTICCIGSV